MAVDTKSRLLRDAEKYVMQGKVPQAIAEYLKVVKSDPSDVLTLNTIGDLYLRLGRTEDANRAFVQVAEAYARNNFLLKAIAVYKKILNANPQNFEINQTLAELYAKQGLSVDARNQYLRVAEICTREGKTQESLDAYAKAVEMDPANSAVQLKLAEIYLAEGIKEKAQVYFAGAGRAQVKAGNHGAAAHSFRRSLELDPIDVETMRGFLDCSIHTSDLAPAVEQLKHALSIVPDSVDFREMLGEAHLANGDIKSASIAFEMTVALDESRYPHFFDVGNAFFEAGDLDGAASALDPIFPKLVSRRETDRAAESYERILEKEPSHVPALSRLGDIYSAVNDQPKYIDTLERIALHHLDCQAPKLALEPLEKILQIAAEDKYLRLHQEAFAQAYPDSPYTPPVMPVEGLRKPPLDISASARDAVAAGEGGGAKFVEIDLLLSYGMTDKALDMLQELAAKDPSDKAVHVRLATVFRDSASPAKAAEQCAILAALERRSNNEEAAQRHMDEARKLSPELIDARFDLAAFARQHGIELTLPGMTEGGSQKSGSLEVDLSGDLSEIFFKDGGGTDAVEPDTAIPPSEFVEEYSQGVATPKAAPESLQDQLQEVDFYIRLGFADEARAKLDEIARLNPDHPELPSRYAKLSDAASMSPSNGLAETATGAPAFEPQFGETDADAPDDFSVLDVPVEAVDQLSLDLPPQAEAPSAGAAAAATEVVPQGAGAANAIAHEGQVNAMFADLIDEVNALTDREIAREDFETHFTLGTAYREMALIDDAISEFQAAVKALDASRHRKEVIQCCGMLSTCYLEKGMPRSAIRWCQTGLGLTEFCSHEALALRYDMGVAHSGTGDAERALQCFGEIFGVDPSYRDVAQRIDELKNGPGRHVP